MTEPIDHEPSFMKKYIIRVRELCFEIQELLVCDLHFLKVEINDFFHTNENGFNFKILKSKTQNS